MRIIQNYKRKRVETILTIAIAICLLSGVLSWKNRVFVYWPLIISGVVLCFGLLTPKVGLIITMIWFKIAQFLGWFSSKIILSILYLFLIIPYSFFMKIFSGRDILNKKYKKSVFLQRNKKIESIDLEDPW